MGIVGLGLIGGSIGLSLRGGGRTILGYDPNSAAAETASRRQCVDELADLATVCQCEVVFVAAPPSEVIAVLEQIRTLRGPETFVSDCTSVKAEVVAWAESAGAEWFVPGHPMAGHERSGAQFASAWMFREAKWLLTPVKSTAKTAIRTVEVVIREMGAQPVRLDAETHDANVALVSHLPHVLAGALVRMGARLPNLDAAAGSWRDVTRVGGAAPEMWTAITMGNSAAILACLDEFTAELAVFRAALAAGDRAGVLDYYQDAATKRIVEKPAIPKASRTTGKGMRRR